MGVGRGLTVGRAGGVGMLAGVESAANAGVGMESVANARVGMERVARAGSSAAGLGVCAQAPRTAASSPLLVARPVRTSMRRRETRCGDGARSVSGMTWRGMVPACTTHAATTPETLPGLPPDLPTAPLPIGART